MEQVKEIVFPDGSRGLIIKPGRGVLRRLRKLAELHGCTIEAVSRRGKVIARCSPGQPAFMTWAGLGRPLPKCGSVQYQNSRRSGAHRSSCWKPRRKRA